MDVRLLVRRAVQYALARYTIVGLAAVPAALLVVTLVRNRHQTIGELATTASALSTSVPLGVLVLVLAARRSVLERIDRMFFREAVDTRTLMGALASSTAARGDSLEAVCRSFSAQLRDTLHLADADILVVDPDSGRLISPTGRLRPLSLDSALASGLLARPDPMTVELDQLDGWVQRLPLDDQQWLADGNVHVLLPLRAGPDLVGGDGARREAQRPPVLARRPRAAGPGGGGAGAEDREPAAAQAPMARPDSPHPADRPTTRRRSCARAAARWPPARPPSAASNAAARWRRRSCRRCSPGSSGSSASSAAAGWASSTWRSTRRWSVRWQSRRCRASPSPNRSGCAARPGRWPASRIRTWRWSSGSRPGAGRRRWSWSTWMAARSPIGCAVRGCRRARSGAWPTTWPAPSPTSTTTGCCTGTSSPATSPSRGTGSPSCSTSGWRRSSSARARSNPARDRPAARPAGWPAPT